MHIRTLLVINFILIFDEGLSCIGRSGTKTNELVSTVSCSDLSGTWMNELGSTMSLKHVINSNMLTGQYNTKVESSEGAASMVTNISGQVHRVTSDGSLLAFNVIWNNGASQSVWVGECRICNNQDMLYTTWLLRSYEPEQRRWLSTSINYNTFWRISGGTGMPAKDDLRCSNSNSDIMGTWTSTTGDSFLISCTTQKDAVKGSHLYMNSESGSPLIGQYAGNGSYTALGFVSARRRTIRGWAGYMYGSQMDSGSIDAAWLEHRFVHNCDTPRKYVKFGMDSYLKDGQNIETS